MFLSRSFAQTDDGVRCAQVFVVCSATQQDLTLSLLYRIKVNRHFFACRSLKKLRSQASALQTLSPGGGKSYATTNLTSAIRIQLADASPPSIYKEEEMLRPQTQIPSIVLCRANSNAHSRCQSPTPRLLPQTTTIPTNYSQAGEDRHTIAIIMDGYFIHTRSITSSSPSSSSSFFYRLHDRRPTKGQKAEDRMYMESL